MKQRLTKLLLKLKAVNALLKSESFLLTFTDHTPEQKIIHTDLNKPFVEATAEYLTDKLKLSIMESMSREMDSAVDEVNNILTGAE